MIFENFTVLVAVLAIAYACISRYLQNRFIDRSQMEGIQAESKRLSDEMKKAQERKDEARVKELMDEQMAVLSKMNGVMMNQFKPMIIILGIFFILMWGVGVIDPSTKDDIYINMTENGHGIYTATYNLSGNPNTGKWVFTGESMQEGAVIGSNETWFAYDAQVNDTYLDPAKGDPIIVSTDKEAYGPGDTVTLYAQPSNQTTPDRVVAVLNNGTSFYVDLPITIPLLNVQRIEQPYWWFVLVSFISSIVLMAGMSLMKKKPADGTAGGKWAGGETGEKRVIGEKV
jgi:hypothetical protein